MPTIHSLHHNISSLVSDQENTVSTLGQQINNVRSAKERASSAVATATQTLVITGNNDRYAELSHAAQSASKKYDFTATVQEWTRQDTANRAEKAGLEKEWGSKSAVQQKSSTLGAAIGEIATALSHISPELDKFDHTMKAIDGHNAKYPKSPITEANHDDFEKFKFGRWCMWVLKFGNHAPQKAYKIISAYDKLYGDLYEDARTVETHRANEKRLEAEQAEKQAAKNELDGVARHMNTLDSAYRGPEGIAQSIRGTVASLILNDVGFAQALLNDVKTPEAVTAVTAGAKARNLAELEASLTAPYKHADATLDALRDPISELSRGNNVVGSDTVRFDMDGLENSVAQAAKLTRSVALSAAASVEAVGQYRAPEGASLATIEKTLSGFTTINIPNNRLDLDFYSLKSSVNGAVRAYEAEQERLEQIRIAAALELDRQRRAAAAEREAAEERRREASTPTFNNTPISGGFNSRSDDSENVTSGSSGIEEDRSENVASGNDGIEP